MSEQNPFQIPGPGTSLSTGTLVKENSSPQKTLEQRMFGLVRSVGWGFPVVFLLTLFGNWLIACVLLGRLPIPMRDDPKGIAGLDIPYSFTLLILFACPLGIIVGLVSHFLPSRRPVDYRVFAFLGFVLVWFSIFMLLRLDPLGIIEWTID